MGGPICVVGHRGAAGLRPENTLEGFRLAMALGVDAVELDVHLTRDGHVVVLHDETVDRTTGGTGRIDEMDLAAVRALDAGGGQKVPTLDEVLDVVRGRCELLCELKADGVEGPAVDAVAARGMIGDVVFISFSLPRLAGARRRGPDCRIGALYGDPHLADVAAAAELGAELLDVDYRKVTRSMIEAARRTGLGTGVWTPNELSEMQAMISLGVDTVTTDRPDLLLGHLGRLKEATS